jgi:DNA mismatch repair protein MutL
MSKIKLLDDSLKNKIAAGEVIERPASVVRELLENSIDAGAASLEVEVSGGGVKLIRVLDDGDGMDRDDVELSLQRHATSKLGGEDDLFNITTMGFRGEALPSIASVSRLTLTTAPRGEPVGVSIETVGGEVKDTCEAPSPGTSVEVRDLFFNTPVRRKFLKRESTELMHIIDAVTRLALSQASNFRFSSPGLATSVTPARTRWFL